jgi:hypothetical protein
LDYAELRKAVLVFRAINYKHRQRIIELLVNQMLMKKSGLKILVMIGGFLCLSVSLLHAQLVTNLTQNTTHGTDIQAAIDAASPDDVIELSNGTYTISNTVNVNKSLTIQGESEAGVILDASGMAPTMVNRVMYITADNVTLRDFTITPVTDPDLGTFQGIGFTIKAGFNSLSAGPIINNLTMERLTVNGAERTPFDIHGIDGVTLTDLTANNTTNGNGINIAGSTNVTISGFTGSGNAWGTIGIYTSQAFNRPSSGVVIDGPSINVNGMPANSSTGTSGPFDGAVYTQDDLESVPTLINTDIVVTDWCYAVTNPDFQMDAEEFTFFVPTGQDAIEVAAALDDVMMTSSSSFVPTGFGICPDPEPLPAMDTFKKIGLMLLVMSFAVFFAYHRMA